MRNIAVIEKRHAASLGDKVIAIVDGEYTLKTLAKDKHGFLLQPENAAYEPIRPQEVLARIAAYASAEFKD